MQIRISTALLILTIFGILFGWYSDRSGFENKLDATVESLELIQALDNVVAQKQGLANANPSRGEGLRRWLAGALISIYEESAAIDKCMLTLDRTDTAFFIANHYLNEIGCETVDEYFSLLRENRLLHESRHNYVLSETPEHESLARFIAKSLASPKPLRLLFQDLDAIFREEFGG